MPLYLFELFDPASKDWLKELASARGFQAYTATRTEELSVDEFDRMMKQCEVSDTKPKPIYGDPPEWLSSDDMAIVDASQEQALEIISEGSLPRPEGGYNMGGWHKPANLCEITGNAILVARTLKVDGWPMLMLKKGLLLSLRDLRESFMPIPALGLGRFFLAPRE